MLILTRHIGQNIMIGDDIVVTVLNVRGTQVRLGIEAPKDVSVHREEIYERVLKEREKDKEFDDHLQAVFNVEVQK